MRIEKKAENNSNKSDINENKNSCPEFPFWGASYPDARCVNGKTTAMKMVIFTIREQMFLAHSVRQKSLLNMTRLVR